ncbi:MAG: radical SAM protein [Candidatus Omnitrophota bacterium]
MLKKLLFYLSWFYRCRVANEKIPLNSSLIITDECNLHCAHCTVAHLGYPKQSYQAVVDDIETLYRKGSRMLVITGGEPFLWRDGSRRLDDVIEFAGRLGFFRTVVCTNGTFELESAADYLWVSLDGYEAQHNGIRGVFYQKVVANIQRSRHKRIYINFTISAKNCATFFEAAEQILRIKNVRGIMFHLFTPYLGSDESLTLTPSQRADAVRRMLRFKWRHPVRVFNTFAGIRALRKDNWKRPIWSSITINRGEVTECCCRRGICDDRVCAACGCSPAVETWVLQTLDPMAIIENMRYL